MCEETKFNSSLQSVRFFQPLIAIFSFRKVLPLALVTAAANSQRGCSHRGRFLIALLNRLGAPARNAPLRKGFGRCLLPFLAHLGKGQYVLKPKRKPRWMALDGIAVGLAGLLFLELYFAAAPPDVPAQRSAWIGSQTQHPQARNVPAPQPAISAMRDMMLSRPLFDPSRRPPAAPTQDLAAPVEIPRLSGIMITPTEKIAVFSPAMGAPIIVSQNSRFGPFTVLAISRESVTIKSPSGVIVVRWDFGDRGKPGIAAAKSTLVAGGIYLSLIKLALPTARSWQGKPLAH
jgi:hypothetical protein